jgi:hypothetical protein
MTDSAEELAIEALHGSEDLQRSRKTREDPECSGETDGESVGILCLNSGCFSFCFIGRKNLVVGETLLLVG